MLQEITRFTNAGRTLNLRNPVTARVAGVQKGPNGKRTREDATGQREPKKGKVAMMQASPIEATGTLEDKIMMPADQDSDPEIY